MASEALGGINSLDHLVGLSEHCWPNNEAQCVRSLEIQHELELGRLLDGEVGWLRTPQNLIHVDGSAAKPVDAARRIRQESPSLDILPVGVHRWQPSVCREGGDLVSV